MKLKRKKEKKWFLEEPKISKLDAVFLQCPPAELKQCDMNNMTQCADQKQCYLLEKQCDQRLDCRDGSDEAGAQDCCE